MNQKQRKKPLSFKQKMIIYSDYLVDPKCNPIQNLDKDPMLSYLVTFLGKLFIQGYRILEKIDRQILILSLMEYQSCFNPQKSSCDVFPQYKIVSIHQHDFTQDKQKRLLLYKELYQLAQNFDGTIQVNILYLKGKKYSIMNIHQLKKTQSPNSLYFYKPEFDLKKTKNFRQLDIIKQGTKLHSLSQYVLKGAGFIRNQRDFFVNILDSYKYSYNLEKVLNTLRLIIGKQIIQNGYSTIACQKWMRKTTKMKYKRFDLIMRNQEKVCIIDWKFSKLKAQSKILSKSTLKKNRMYIELAKKDYRSAVQLIFYCIHCQSDPDSNHHKFSTATYQYRIDQVQVGQDDEDSMNVEQVQDDSDVQIIQMANNESQKRRNFQQQLKLSHLNPHQKTILSNNFIDQADKNIVADNFQRSQNQRKTIANSDDTTSILIETTIRQKANLKNIFEDASMNMKRGISSFSVQNGKQNKARIDVDLQVTDTLKKRVKTLENLQEKHINEDQQCQNIEKGLKKFNNTLSEDIPVKQIMQVQLQMGQIKQLNKSLKNQQMKKNYLQVQFQKQHQKQIQKQKQNSSLDITFTPIFQQKNNYNIFNQLQYSIKDSNQNQLKKKQKQQQKESEVVIDIVSSEQQQQYDQQYEKHQKKQRKSQQFKQSQKSLDNSKQTSKQKQQKQMQPQIIDHNDYNDNLRKQTAQNNTNKNLQNDQGLIVSIYSSSDGKEEEQYQKINFSESVSSIQSNNSFNQPPVKHSLLLVNRKRQTIKTNNNKSKNNQTINIQKNQNKISIQDQEEQIKMYTLQKKNQDRRTQNLIIQSDKKNQIIQRDQQKQKQKQKTCNKNYIEELKNQKEIGQVELLEKQIQKEGLFDENDQNEEKNIQIVGNEEISHGIENNNDEIISKQTNSKFKSNFIKRRFNKQKIFTKKDHYKKFIQRKTTQSFISTNNKKILKNNNQSMINQKIPLDPSTLQGKIKVKINNKTKKLLKHNHNHNYNHSRNQILNQEQNPSKILKKFKPSSKQYIQILDSSSGADIDEQQNKSTDNKSYMVQQLQVIQNMDQNISSNLNDFKKICSSEFSTKTSPTLKNPQKNKTYNNKDPDVINILSQEE